MNDQSFTWPGFDSGNPTHSTLHGWLVLDIQDQPDLVLELLAQLHGLQRGGDRPPGGSGNGYEFDFLTDGLRLACLYPGDELSPVTLPYALVETALKAWLDHLSGAKG
jgi:hypothetical protein